MDTGIPLTEQEKKAIRVALATAILRGATGEPPPDRREALDAHLTAGREATVLDAPAGSGDAVCQELALLARTRVDASPRLLAAFLAAAGVLRREAPASFPRVAALARSVAGTTVDAAAPGVATRALAFLRRLSAVHAGALDAAVLRGTAAALADLALAFADGVPPARRAAAMNAAGPLIALFAELARRRLVNAPEDGPAVAEATAGLLRDFEPAPLAAALLADRFACPPGAAA